MTNLKSARTQLVKETQQFAKMMGDMETFFTKRWKDGAGPTLEMKEYVGQQQLNTLIEGFQQIASTLEVIHSDLSAMEAKQKKQDISIVKAGQNKLRIQSKIEEEAVRNEITSASETPEWAVGLRLLDPELYTKGGRVYYLTMGLSPRDIQYNELDLEMLHGDLDLSNLTYIRERWATFSNKVQEYTGNTLGQFIKAYAERRGIPYVAKKRGRKSSQNN
jgi:hypothetical protein